MTSKASKEAEEKPRRNPTVSSMGQPAHQKPL